MIFSLHGLTEFEQLIRSRTSFPSAVRLERACHTNLPACESGLVDLQQLQEDVFTAHVVGKPLIEPPISVRINFPFRDDGPHSKEKFVHAYHTGVVYIVNLSVQIHFRKELC